MKLNKENKQKINYIFDILEQNKINVLIVRFFGSGDDGNMEIDSYDGPEIDLSEPTIFVESVYKNGTYQPDNVGLEHVIFSVCDYMLDSKGIDYANGNGNDGTISFTVKNRNVSMNYLVTDTEEYEFSV